MRAYDKSVREFFRQLILEGETISSASAIIGIHRSTGSTWLRQFRTEEVLRENGELRQADRERRRELSDVKEINKLLRRDNNELRAANWQLRSATRPLVVRLLFPGLRWLLSAVGAGVIGEAIGLYAQTKK